MRQQFTGAGVALVTPFTEKNEVDFEALARVVENQVNGGMDYLVALGTTAETPTLTDDEKREVVNLAKNNSGRLPVVVGMGGNDTQKVIHDIEAFDFDGIGGILSVTPYYNKPTQDGLLRHYAAIAAASPVPVILYNVPGRTGVNLEPETVVKLARENEKIVAVKEASGVLGQITRIIKNAPAGFTVISGDDMLALPTIAIGGQGLISVVANALPQKLSSLVHFALDGRYAEARELHLDLADIFRLLFKEGNPGGVKALMHYMQILENELRLPLAPVSEKTYNEIKDAYLKLK